MTGRHDPWIRYGQTGLYAVPSVHYRLVFAQLVLEACRRIPFDVIAVELPPSYGEKGIAEAIGGMAPVPGLVIDPIGGTVWKDVPVDDRPDCRETCPRPLQRAVMYPVSPCDSIVMALRCPRLLRDHYSNWEPEVRLVDDEHRAGERQEVPIPDVDDYEVITRGLPAYYSSMEEAFQRGRIESVDRPREIVMGAELRRLLDEGKSILYVCGAAHWRRIREYLDSGRCDAPVRRGEASPTRLVMAPVRPEVVWLWGWLDDIPFVTWLFGRALESGEDFDKEIAVIATFWRTVEQQRIEGNLISPRRLQKMEQFHQNLLLAAGRLLPRLNRELLPAAKSCIGEPFTEALWRQALDYPLPDETPFARFVRLSDGGVALITKEESFHIASDPEDSGERLLLPLEPVMSEVEKGQVETSHCTRTAPEDQELFLRVAGIARHVAHRTRRKVTARRFQGDIGLGFAWRPTVRAMARGETNVYVRQMSRGRQGSSACDGTCPIAWLFSSSAVVAPPHSAYHSSEAVGGEMLFYDHMLWYSELRSLGDDTGIRQFRTAYALSLTRGLLPHIRQTPELLAAFLARYPEQRRCMVLPADDPELSRFRGFDQAVACGVKYAADHMLVVALPSHEMGSHVLNYARERKVRIIRVSRDSFEPRALERLALYHSVPAPTNWGKPFPFYRRFIPSI